MAGEKLYKGFETLEDYLAHHGVLGMKWGVRKRRPSSSSRSKTKTESVKASPEKKEAANKTASSSRPTKIEIKQMPTDELRDRINRLQLEKQLAQLTTPEKSAAKKAINEILATSGKQVATTLLTKALTSGAQVAFNAAASNAPAGSSQKLFMEMMAKQKK